MPQEGEGSTPQEGQEPTPAATTTEPEAPKAEGKTFDADYVKGLRAEAARYRTEAQEAKARIEQFEESQKSELEKAQTKAQKLEAEARDAKARLLRYEVATEKNVPAKLVPLLTAADRDALEAQADLILENAKPADPDFDGGPREPAPEPKSPEEEHNSLFLQAVQGLNRY